MSAPQLVGDRAGAVRAFMVVRWPGLADEIHRILHRSPEQRKARHLLADNTGLLDLGRDTNFTNVVELSRAQGGGVTHVGPGDTERLASLGLELDEKGGLRLSGGVAAPAASVLCASGA